MVSEDELKNYLQAARIHAAAQELAESLVKEGAGVLKTVEAIEKEIVDSGGKPAFPINISFDHEAAHNTPVTGDARVFKKEVVKVDIGVHVEGCIIDAGFTVDLSGEHGKLVEASKRALEDALSVIKAGRKAKEVGVIVQKTIESYGFKPVENLTGHLLEPYNLHAGIEVPNVPKGGEHVFQEGEVFAIEPFASTGAGSVADGPAPAEIFSIIALKNVRMQSSRELLREVFEERQLLPFAKRWYADRKMIDFTLRDLTRQGILHDYPILVDEAKGLVSQAESTVIIEKDSVRVLV